MPSEKVLKYSNCFQEHFKIFNGKCYVPVEIKSLHLSGKKNKA